ADGARASRGEAACHVVRNVAGLFDRCPDKFAGFLADRVGLVDGAGDRDRRNAGEARDILNAHGLRDARCVRGMVIRIRTHRWLAPPIKSPDSSWAMR